MEATTSAIGKCVGCNGMGRLEGDACHECISSPNRGPRWLELARRIRTDPEFALACYTRCRNDGDKAIFISKYGLPPGGEDPRKSDHRPLAQVIPFRRR